MKFKAGAAAVVLMLVCLLAWSGQAQRSKVETRWEYQVIFDPAYQNFVERGDLNKGVKELNDWASQGWEIIAVNKIDNGVMLYLKRAR